MSTAVVKIAVTQRELTELLKTHKAFKELPERAQVTGIRIFRAPDKSRAAELTFHRSAEVVLRLTDPTEEEAAALGISMSQLEEGAPA